MARPEQLSPALLLKSITHEPAKPSALATALGVSRATVHRKLEALLAEGLVVKIGDGPTAAYRLPSAQEAVARADALRPDGLVRLVLDKRSAWAARESLELFTRIGIGQLEEIEHDARMQSISADDPYEKLEQLKQLVFSFKRLTTGMPPHASFGIYNPKVPVQVTKAWALMKALRHRIAWDQTPEGSIGVWHDEPMFEEDQLPGLSVLSDTPGEDGKPTRYLIEMPREAVALLGQAAKMALRLRIHDFSVLMELVNDGLIRHTEHASLGDTDKAAAAQLTAAMQAVMLGDADASPNVALGKSEERLLHLVKACEAFDGSTERVVASFEPEGLIEVYPLTDSPIAVTLDSLPEGMLLNFKGGMYRVIAPRGEDDLLTVIAESRSLQTVIQMAKNLSGKGPARNFTR